MARRTSREMMSERAGSVIARSGRALDYCAVSAARRFAPGIVLLSLALLGHPSDVVAGNKLAVGDKPEIQWMSMEGKQIKSEDLRGWVVVVHFWASDDDWTATDGAKIRQLYDTFNRCGVQFVGFCIDKRADLAKDNARKAGYAWPQAYDGKAYLSQTLTDWGVVKPPAAFVFSPEGVLQWRGHPSAVEGQIETALQKTPPQLPKDVRRRLTMIQVQEATKLLAGRGQDMDYREALQVLEYAWPDVLGDLEVVDAAKKLMPYFEPREKKDRDSLAIHLTAYPKAAGAIEVLREAVKVAATQPSAAQVAATQQAADRRNALGKSRLDAAEALAKQDKHTDAYRAFKLVVDRFGDTPSAAVAKEKLKAYENDAPFIAKLKAAQATSDAEALLDTARAYEKADRADLAKKNYEQIIQHFPDSKAAEEARKALAKPPQ